VLTDSVGLGYTCERGEIHVHYPQPDGGYGSGFPIGPIPQEYFACPPNAITAERARLWRRLLNEAPPTAATGR
jgi:hypothetical protein